MPISSSLKKLLFILFCAGALAQDFRAGFTRRDITPGAPVPLWGYGTGPRPQFVSNGVSDPLSASALVLASGDQKLAIVGLDLGRAPTAPMRERVLEAVRREAGVNNLYLVGSHTHHAPVLELLDEPGKGRGVYDATIAWYRELETRIADAIVEAAKRAEPARYGWAKTNLPLNRNRHTKFEPKPIDPEMIVLRFDSLDGKPIAIAVNWAAHPTTIDPKDVRISADYPGALRRALESEMGAGSLFLQGAAGDLSTLRGPNQDYVAYGKALAAEAIKLARSIDTKAPAKPAILGAGEDFDFASRIDFTNAFFKAVMSKEFFPELVNAVVPTMPGNRIRPRMTVALLNSEVAMAGFSGEPFSAHSVRLKQRSRAPLTMVTGYTNDHHMYFCTIEAAAEGGYGADATTAWVEIGGPERMFDQALKSIYRLIAAGR